MINGKISDCVAIWIDHRIAFIVYVPDSRFHNGKNIWVEEGLGNGEPGHSLQHQNGHRQEALKRFYDKVICQLKHLIHVNEILIMGPGQAKYEFRHRINHHKVLKGKIADIQNASRMSEKELKAFASQYFAQLN